MHYANRIIYFMVPVISCCVLILALSPLASNIEGINPGNETDNDVTGTQSPVTYSNIIAADMAESGMFPQECDTIYIGGEYEFRVLIENSFDIYGTSLGFEISSGDGVTWEYVAKENGFGHIMQCVTVVPESRLGPHGEPFDMTGLLVTEQEVTGADHDTIMMGGVAMHEGIPTGPLEHMMSIHFRPVSPASESGVVGTLCLDSCFVPPSGAVFIFVNSIGQAIPVDTVIVADCWPVKLICGNPNGDNDVNVGDPVFMVNYIFRGGPAPNPWQLGDANCDGDLNVGDVIYLVHAAFRTGPLPVCCD